MQQQTELIRITKKVKKQLDNIKILPRETYNEVLIRLLKNT